MFSPFGGRKGRAYKPAEIDGEIGEYIPDYDDDEVKMGVREAMLEIDSFRQQEADKENKEIDTLAAKIEGDINALI